MSDPYAAFSDPVGTARQPALRPAPAPRPAARPQAAPIRFADDNDALIRTVIGEARGESPEGRLAVASVIRNRARQRGLTPSQVVLEPNQFEPWGNPETRQSLLSIKPTDPLYQEVARQIASDQDPTGGASHFYAPKAQAQLGREKPSWDNGSGRAIGNHLFFNLDGSPADESQGDVNMIGQAQGDDPYAEFSDAEVVETFPTDQAAPTNAPGSSEANPIDLAALRYQDEFDALKQGAWAKRADGTVFQLTGDAFTDSSTRPYDEAQGGNVFVRPPNMEDRVGAFATAASEQIPFLDESVAFTTGLASGQGFDAMREAQDANRDRLNQTERGARVAGGLTGFASTLLLPGVASSGKYITSGANRVEQARRAAQVGLGGGLLGGFANTDGDFAERSDVASKTGLIGAVAGPLANEAVQAVPGLLRRGASGVSEATARVGRGLGREAPEQAITPQATDSAMDYVKGLLRQSGRDLSADPVSALGKPITAAEAMGRTGISQMTALSRRSGQAGDMAVDVLGTRAVEQSSRVLDDLARASGREPGAAEDAISTLARESRDRAAPLYEAAYQAQNVDSPVLRDLMNRPSVRAAMSKAVKIAQDEGRNPEDIGFIVTRQRVPGGGSADEVVEVRSPSMQTWDYIKRGMDDVLEAYRDPTSRRMNLDTGGRAAEANRQALRAELTNADQPWGESYKAALSAGGDAPRVEAAFREGPSLFSSRVNERTFRSRVQGMNETERSATLSGIVDDLYNKARTGRVNIRQLRTPAVREKLSLLMGPEKTDDFLTRLGAEADMARSGARMAPGTNSVTAEALEAMREMDQGVSWASRFSDKVDDGQGLLRAAVETGADALMSPVAGFIRGVQSPANQPVRDEIARLLLMNPDDLAKLLAQRPTRVRPSNPAAATGGLLSAPIAQSAGLLSANR